MVVLQYLHNTRTCLFLIRASRGAAMLVHSVPMQGRKTLAHDNLDTSATHTDLVRDVTDSIKMAAVTAVSRDFKTRPETD